MKIKNAFIDLGRHTHILGAGQKQYIIGTLDTESGVLLVTAVGQKLSESVPVPHGQRIAVIYVHSGLSGSIGREEVESMGFELLSKATETAPLPAPPAPKPEPAQRPAPKGKIVQPVSLKSLAAERG